MKAFRLTGRHVDALARKGLFPPEAGYRLKEVACRMRPDDEAFGIGLNFSGSIRLVPVPYGSGPEEPYDTSLAEVRLDCGPEVAREFIENYLNDLDVKEVK